jgi:hypothetical protein
MARRTLGVAVAMALGLGVTALGVPASSAAGDATMYVVQGLPGKTVTVKVDGKTVVSDQKSGTVSDPLRVASGKRRLTLTAAGKVIIDQMVSIGADWSADVVAHLPADPDGKPLLTTYKNDLSSVPKDKASLTVAHTAAVPPADVTVNKKVLFADIANGESLHLVVPVATYEVAIVPTGKSKPVFFGPVDLTVQGGALNAVYAIGNPASKTMNVVVHVVATSPSGSSRPKHVNTGTGGQAVGAKVIELPALTR